MMKMRLLAVVLFVLGAAGVVLAAEVINVDIKGYNDNTPYIGNGAYDVGPNTVWTVFYGGFGVPVGSSRSEGLQSEDQPFFCSVYAAQVWLGDDGQDHTYQYGSSLMDDGFVANPSTEPKLNIYGQGAFQGVYDIYVYGRDAGSFTLTRYGVPTTQTVSGDANAGEFKLGQNYVIFSSVDINNVNSNDLYLTYTNKLNALQFVKKKSPVAVKDGTIIWAGNWDVAGERNIRSDDPQGFGPDTMGAEPNIYVGNLDVGEFMGYDITVDDVNQGRYFIVIDVNTGGPVNVYRANPLRIYLDDKFVADVCAMTVGEANSTIASVNLFKGSHTVKWHLPFQGIGGSTGSNLIYLQFTRTGNIAMNDCNEVGFYGVRYPGDLSGNCAVGLDDLALMVDNWLICNNPDPNGCF
jgi:hypothetical protein